MHSIGDRPCNTEVLQLPDPLLIEEVEFLHQRFPNEFGIKDFASVLIGVARFEVPVVILDLDLPPPLTRVISDFPMGAAAANNGRFPWNSEKPATNSACSVAALSLRFSKSDVLRIPLRMARIKGNG